MMADETIAAKVAREYRQRRITFNVWLCLGLLYGLSAWVFFLALASTNNRIAKLEQAAHVDHGTHGSTPPGTARHEARATMGGAALEQPKAGNLNGLYGWMSVDTLGSSALRWVEPNAPMVTVAQIDRKTTRVTFQFGGMSNAFVCENWRAER